MNPSQVVEWQNPFVDVFKYYNVFDGSGHDKKGNIAILQDNSIGRRVFKIQGSISATNYVLFPPAKSGIQTLGLNGRYLYIELCPTEFLFSIHFDFTIAKRNPVRFTLSNMYESYKATSNTLQIPFPRDIRNQWVVLCIDIEQHMEKYGLFPQGAFKSYSKIYVLKSVQICSTITLRGIYTSDNKYNSTTIPREMDFKMPKGKWEDVYKFIYLPDDVEAALKKRPESTRKGRSILKKTSTVKESAKSTSVEKEKKASQSKGKSSSPKKPAPPKELDETQPHPVKHHDPVAERPPIRNEERAKLAWYKPMADSITTYTDQKSSLLSLDCVLGFTGRRCPDVRWSQDPESQDEILYASGKLIVGFNQKTREQRFFVGNTSSICCLDLSRDGSRVVVAQEDREACIKVFNYRSTKCIGTIPLNMKEVRSVSFSYDKKYVSVTGVDNYNRDAINIWDLEHLETKHKPQLVAKQVSEFNILSCKFSPCESDKLVSCGRENIRFWRIKNDHLAGGAVVLNQHARDTVFTVLEYDFNHENPATVLNSDSTKRVFVGTKHGLLFQINYLSRELEGVFKLHDSCICSLAISAGFCVTGSEDQYLRVWPLDFSEFFLEAKHEGIIISLDISHDALKLVCGISSGGLGMIDLTDQSHRTLLRAHTDSIRKIDYNAFSNYFISLSDDFTIRVWDSKRYEQMYEFTYSKEDPCTCISSSSRGLFFAAGFQSGILRIFDIEKTCIIEESKFHNSPMTCVLYSPDGKYLVTADQQANYNLFDCERGLQPVKVFEAEIENDNPIATFTNDSATLATTGAYTSHINIWDLYRFFRRGRIIVKGSPVKAMKFSSDDLAFFVLLNDGRIKMYGVKSNEPVLLKDITSSIRVTSGCLDLSVNNQYVLTGCDDSKVRIWDILNNPGDIKEVFPQEGHVEAVKSAVFSSDGHQVITAGHDEGIYVWSFKGDMDPMDILDEELENFSAMAPGRNMQGMALSRKDEEEVDKLGNDIFEPEEDHKSPLGSDEKRKVGSQGTPPKPLQRRESGPMKELTNLSPHMSRNRDDDLEKSEKTHFSPLESRTQAFLKSPKSAAVRRLYKFKKPSAPTRSPSPTKTPSKAPGAAERAGRKYVKTAFRRNNKLPFKHYALDSDGRLAEQKNKTLFKHRNKLEMEFILGYNNEAHSNIVWNIPGGWFAYGTENFVIIEQLISERSQKVVTFPEFVSCLALSNDGALLAVGSATYDTNIYSNVHIIDCYNFKVVRTLKFHNKGIQALTFSLDNKYLISVGNFRECTIGVWDPNNGQLIASSYTLTNINEVRVKPYTRTGVLEFTTVGADQVIQWILTNDSKLLNSETFIQPKNTKSVEITAFNYVLVNDRDYVLLGTAEGEILLLDLSSQEMELRRKISNEEIVDIISNNTELRAVITCLDSNVYIWNYSEKLKFEEDTNFKHVELKYPANCIYMDDTLNEGLIGTMDGGILYANFKENLFSKLVGASSVENYVVRVKELDENCFATFHAFGGVKLWSAFTGEELTEFAYAKISCKDILLHRGRSELFCFYDDNSCRIVDMNNFDKVSTLTLDEFTANPDDGPRYIADSAMIHEPGQALPYYLCVTNKGELYISDLREKDEVVWAEAMEQNYSGTLAQFNTHSKTKVLNICFDDATIQTLAFYRGNSTYPDIGILDLWNLMDDPHGDLDKNEEAKEATMTIYGTKVQRKYKITTSFTETKGLYYVITNYLQYVILRNSSSREIVRRISLESFPASLYFEQQTKNIIVGLDDGWIVYYDHEGKELQRQRNFNDGGVIGLRISKNEDQKKLVALEAKAMTIYKYL